MATISSSSSSHALTIPSATPLSDQELRALQRTANITTLSIAIQSIGKFIILAGIGALIFYGGYAAYETGIPALLKGGGYIMAGGVIMGLWGIGAALIYYNDMTKYRHKAQQKLLVERSISRLEINQTTV